MGGASEHRRGLLGDPADDSRPSASIRGDRQLHEGSVWIGGPSKPHSPAKPLPSRPSSWSWQVDLVLRAGGLQVGRRCGSVVSANAVVAEAPRTAPSRHAGCQAPPDAYRSPLRWRRPSAHVLAIAKGSRSRANRSSPVVLGLTGRRGRLELLPTGRTRDLGSA
jgi:hypothetical protein